MFLSLMAMGQLKTLRLETNDQFARQAEESCSLWHEGHWNWSNFKIVWQSRDPKTSKREFNKCSAISLRVNSRINTKPRDNLCRLIFHLLFSVHLFDSFCKQKIAVLPTDRSRNVMEPLKCEYLLTISTDRRNDSRHLESGNLLPNWRSAKMFNFCIPFPVQNGNSSVQNGKIIISINIKNIL